MPRTPRSSRPSLRITSRTHAALKALAKAEAKSMQAVLEEAVEGLRRLRFLEGVNDEYAALRRDHVAWKSVEDERRAWDASLLDGLSPREAGDR